MTKATGASLLILLVGACGHAGPAAHVCTKVVQPPAAPRVRAAPASLLNGAKTYELVIQSNCGSFTIRLDTAQSPHATASLVALARSRYFDRTAFMGGTPGATVEAGDPTVTGNGGPGYATIDTPPRSASYGRGVVAMARERGQPRGAGGSIFFVVTARRAALPPDYAIVGNVVDGLDVVDLIETFAIGGDLSSQVSHISGLLNRTVEIERATVATK